MTAHRRPSARQMIFSLFFSAGFAALAFTGFTAFSGDGADVSGGEKPGEVLSPAPGTPALETATFGLG